MNDIINISGVDCYEKDGTAYLRLDTVARGLGFVKKADSGNEVVNWTRVRGYLADLGVVQKCTTGDFIPENIFYRLAMKAKNAAAEAFQAKIADEVIPSIRKHGAYMTEQTIDQILSDPDTIIKLATNLKEERAKRKAVEAENERQRQIIKDFEPIKQYVDIILESTGTLTTSQIAADYDLSARTLNKILHEEGVQHNVNGQWILYRKHMGMGYTKSKTIPITRSDGSPDTKLHTQWTQKGRMMIHEILTRRGIKAVMDKEIEKMNGARKNGDELLSACGISGTCIRVIV